MSIQHSDICCWKFPNFVHIFLLLYTKLQVYLNRVKITFSCFKFFQIWNTNNAHLGLHFPKILKNSKKIEGACTIISQFLSQYVVAPTGSIINAMDLKIFSATIMLLKMDCFEGFSNRSNVDELVINNMSVCNCNNYKLHNNNYKLDNKLVFSNSEYFLI